MLENIKSRTQKLISLYETEKAERERMAQELEECRAQNEAYRKQIEESRQIIDNLKLTGAFRGTAADRAQAKKQIDELIAEIDRCIALLEG